jgi:hypothetical protein
MGGFLGLQTDNTRKEPDHDILKHEAYRIRKY